MFNSKKILVYTDASFKDNYGGWGAVIVVDHKFIVIGGKIASYIKTSGSAEFYAIYKSLLYIVEHFKHIDKITFNTDHNGIVTSFKNYMKNKEFKGKDINKGLINLVFSIARQRKIFINTNHVKAHQYIVPNFPRKTFDNLKKTSTAVMIRYHERMKKQYRFHTLNSSTYNKLKKLGWNKSAICNNMADRFSKQMRKKYSRTNWGYVLMQ